MDFQCRVEVLSKFLSKAKMDQVTDLILHGNEQGIFAKFSDVNSSMYIEIYEPGVKVAKSGNIRIPSIKQVLATLGRIESDVIRVVSDETKFIITDGNQVGKSKVNLNQVEKEYINSNSRIEGKLGLFNREELSYVSGTFKFEEGFELDIGVLDTILKDAKAFEVERYNFSEEAGVLACKIENVALGNFYNRKLPTIQKIGTNPIKPVIVGLGFRDMVNAISSDKDIKKLKVFFNEAVILLTDNTNFFYCLHTLENK